MHEIELRFHVPAEQRERLRRYLDQRQRLPRTALAAIYYDSSERQLARAGIGLRLRREGRRWVQTVKGPAEDGITRLEHNATLPPGAARELDLSRHDGHPLGERLAALQAEGLQLLPVFSTAIRRAQRRQRLVGAEIELAWDEGQLLAGDGAAARSLAVHELELELMRGRVDALLRHAHGLVARLPLSLDLRSKAERGERLAQGQTVAPARKARALRLRADMQPGEALRALLLNCFEQIGNNASQVAVGESGTEHVHQLRVGLRRLRSGLRLFRGLWPELEHPALPAFEAQAATLFRALGAVRDADVLADGLSPALRAALAEVLPAQEPVTAATATATATGAGATAAANCLRQAPAQQFLIETLGWLNMLGQHPSLVAAPAGAATPSLRDGLQRRLRRWQRQLQRDCAGFAQLTSEQRHQLRKRFKRLRYGCEFAAALFGGAALKAALKPVVKAQELLGQLNDLELALDAARGRAASEPQALFELGWLAARRGQLLAQCLPLMADVAAGPVVARGRPRRGERA